MNSEPIRVLCVGADLGATVSGFDWNAENFRVRTVTSPTDAIDHLGRNEMDCIVCRIEPTEQAEMDGIELLRAVRKQDFDLPFVLLTSEGMDRAGEAIAAGVTEVCPPVEGKSAVLLAHRIERAVGEGTHTVDASEQEVVSESTASSAGDGDNETSTSAILNPDQYRTFVEQIADPVYVVDDEGTFVTVNSAFVEYLGYDREYFEDLDIREFFDDSQLETALETVEPLLENGGGRDQFELEVETADGEQRIAEIHVTIITDDEGEYAASVSVVRDITERKERIRELGLHEAIIETAPIGLLVMDEDGYIRWHNDRFMQGAGLDDRDLEGTHFGELAAEGFFPNSTLEDYVERVRHLLSSSNDDEYISYEEEWFGADGEQRLSHVNMGLLPLEDGEFQGTVIAYRDITDRVRYQRELERQNDRLEKFASLVSHDLRNPLNVAQGYLDILEANHDDETIDEIRWSIDRMEELIDDLLALARYGRPVTDRKRVDLATVVDDAWAGIDSKTATLEAELGGTITAHEGRVRELFENLFRNAIEHGGADVTVTVDRLDSVDNGSDGFFVEDDGDGLPETEDIFEFGHTTTEDGTGFGLSIVTEIADAHGWDVTACDGRHGGARFEIRGITVLEENVSDEFQQPASTD